MDPCGKRMWQRIGEQIVEVPIPLIPELLNRSWTSLFHWLTCLKLFSFKFVRFTRDSGAFLRRGTWQGRVLP